MDSKTASQIEAARKNLRGALSILPNVKPEGLNDHAWGELVASYEYIESAVARLDQAKYCDATSGAY